MVESKRKKDESFEGFLRRFNKRLQQSGVLRKARSLRVRQATKSRNRQKESALVSLELKSKYEYLKKTGKMKEDSRGRW